MTLVIGDVLRRSSQEDLLRHDTALGVPNGL
jgi:hypothetical protein